jgi:ribulose 1,5-bisphosphate synthetase/thiazole synthase
MNDLSTGKTILEPAKKLNVMAEAEVVVVGGGPAGITAAIAAAREGAKTLLLERYGHLGGMATGGLVLMINQFPAGQCQEWKDRLEPLGGVRDISKTKEPGLMRNSCMVAPELLKCVLNDMALEAGVNLLLHSWGASAVVEQNKVKGVIFESKSGRQAVLGQVIIDATGDGDIFASAGAEFGVTTEPKMRNAGIAMVFRIANVDFDKFCDFRIQNPQQWQDMRTELNGVAGFHVGPVPAEREDSVWLNSFITGRSPLKVEDLTWIETTIRKSMLPVHDYFKKKVPGFKNSYIYDSASQIGTRGSRMLKGENALTKIDLEAKKTYTNVVGIFPSGAAPNGPFNVELPYGCLVPEKMEGLLVAGRCFSSDQPANNLFNVIPHCVVMGQAAGTAAALAVKTQVQPRRVDIKTLQKKLIGQGMSLPGQLR